MANETLIIDKTMRAQDDLCVVLVPCLQAMLFLTAATTTPGSAAATLFVVLAVVVPFACYVWGWGDNPLELKTSRRMIRIAVLLLISGGLTVGGMAIGLSVVASRVPPI